MRKSIITHPLRFTARNDYALLSIVHPCTMERTSLAIRQNIASARNHRRPWRSRYEASTDKEQNLINSDYMVTIYTNQLFCK